ncbi:Acylphosphatase [uncultured archaeon]|nr:Acylphosphatase [uncultured archaeon]
MKKAVRLYIEGTVQGIFFRQFIKENAERNDIRGFARNLEDGRVEVFIEGNNDKVDKMIELCKTGPKHAKIGKVEVKEEKFQDFKEFKVLHI